MLERLVEDGCTLAIDTAQDACRSTCSTPTDLAVGFGLDGLRHYFATQSPQRVLR